MIRGLLRPGAAFFRGLIKEARGGSWYARGTLAIYGAAAVCGFILEARRGALNALTFAVTFGFGAMAGPTIGRAFVDATKEVEREVIDALLVLGEANGPAIADEILRCTRLSRFVRWRVRVLPLTGKLHALEASGVLAARWEPDRDGSRRGYARRVYMLSDAFKSELAAAERRARLG